MQKVNVYVDGLNLYNGLLSKDYRRYLWLDLRALFSKFLGDDQEIESIKYFTARVSAPQDRRARQGCFLDALVYSGVEIIEGKQERRPCRCPSCGHNWKRMAEKQTDVAIASHIVADSATAGSQEQWVMSGDSDLVPAIRMAREKFGTKVVLISPPGRESSELASLCDASLHVRRSWLNQCQFEPEIELDNGRRLARPEEWT